MNAVADTPLTLRFSDARGPVVGLVALLIAVALLSLAVGATPVPLSEVVRALAGAAGLPLHAVDPLHDAVVVDLRAPRVVAGGLVGASLAVGGVLVQGWFRNPLADPGALGIASGAALAVTIALFVGPLLPEGWAGAAIPVAAFGGALGATALVHRIGRAPTGVSVITLLLAGIAVSALATAGTGLLLTIASDAQLRTLTFWTLGSVSGATWGMLAWLVPLLVPALLLSQRLASPLDALLLGEATAAHLGVDLPRTQRWVAVLVALLVGASVAATGVIGFVGLVAPHLVRRVVGPRHVIVLPCAALAGAVLVMAADAASRTVAAPVELPVGAVTTLVGAPLFLVLLAAARRELT